MTFGRRAELQEKYRSGRITAAELVALRRDTAMRDVLDRSRAPIPAQRYLVQGGAR